MHDQYIISAFTRVIAKSPLVGETISTVSPSIAFCGSLMQQSCMTECEFTFPSHHQHPIFADLASSPPTHTASTHSLMKSRSPRLCGDSAHLRIQMTTSCQRRRLSHAAFQWADAPSFPRRREAYSCLSHVAYSCAQPRRGRETQKTQDMVPSLNQDTPLGSLCWKVKGSENASSPLETPQKPNNPPPIMVGCWRESNTHRLPMRAGPSS